ncbi:MAG: efflux RND transporter permease subunit [Calditrichaeota bacterium]|nr:efflux RND transporter permease subunit [Calditrichota bacterium]
MAFIKDYTQRKVSISMAFVLVAVFGLISMLELPVELFPPIDQPVFQVKVNYEVNNYKIVEQSITKRVERQLSSLDGVIFTESLSFPNYSTITVYLDWKKDITSVLLEAREKLDQLNLPPDATRPLLEKNDPSRFPVFSYVIKGKSVEILSQLVEDHLSRVFDQIDGIAEAQFIGTRERRIILVPKDDKLKEYGLTYNDISSKLSTIPQTSSGAVIRDGFREWSLRINDFINSIDDLNDIKLIKQDNRYVLLKDVCDIRFDYERSNQFVINGDQEGVLVHLIKESKANLLESADNVYEQIKKLENYYGDLKFVPVFDGAKSIKSAIYQLVIALLIGGILSFAVLIFFFKNLRVPLYLAVVIPTSILGTFIGMWFFDVSFNLISLGGLGLGIGMLIDNGIIIMEYVKQRAHKGMNEAVHDSIKVLWLPMLTSTLTSLSVFLPLLTVGGMSSVLFQQQAITISLSLGWAYITAITLLPLIILVFPPDFSKREEHKNKNWTLLSLRHPKITWAVLIGLIIVLPLCLYFMEKRLLPEGKSSKIVASYQVNPLTTKDDILKKAHELNELLLSKNFSPVIYLTDEKEFSAERWLTIEVPIENESDKDMIQYEVTSRLAGNWEVKYEKALLRQIVDERQDYYSINIRVTSPADKNRLDELVDPYKDQIEVIGNSDRLYVVLELDREKLMQYNLNVNNFVTYIQTKLYGQENGEMKSFNRTDKIVMTGNFDERTNLDDFLNSDYYFNNRFYKINQFLSWRIEDQPLWSFAVNQTETVMLRKSVYDKDSSEYMSNLKDKISAAGFNMNDDITAFRISETNTQLGLSLVFSLILILFILAVQFESMKHPLMVVAIVPISFGGAFLSLWILGETINVIALTGLVILMGIVINDTILKIDAIRRYRFEGNSLLKAILKGSHSRLKAIILTTLSTIVGSIPLLFGSEGVELRQPIAIVLVAGMAFSTYLTIQTIPLLYYTFIKNE